MPKTIKLQVSMPHDSKLARDAVVNTLYLRHNLFDVVTGFDTHQLAVDLAALYKTKLIGTGAARPITVKTYEVGGPPPHDPIDTVVQDPTAAPVAINYPAEIALCLSFKGGQRAWQRGRIFLMPHMMQETVSASSISPRPPDSALTRALDFAQGVADLGGVDIDWVVHSATRNIDTKVSEAWCDDEWDTQRRRGLEPTKRMTRATGG